MDRRKFLKTTTAGAVGLSLSQLAVNNIFAQDTYPDVAWIENGEPVQLLKSALEVMGGMKRFINKGDVVVVKPNIGWDRAPEFAANTNPDLVAEVVKECFKAGAKEVKIFDRTCNNKNRCYKNSQIQAKAEDAGADVFHMRKNKYKEVEIPKGEVLKSWEIYKDYLEADKVINIPIAKHHSLNFVSLGLKNLMGVMGGNRGSLHNEFFKKLVDIDSQIMPTLTIVDAYRMLMANGPVGGNLADVKTARSLIMSPCTVSADYTALKLFELDLEQVGHVNEAYKRGLNLYDLKKLNVKKIAIS